MKNWKYTKTWVNIQTTDPMAYHLAGVNWVIIGTLTWRNANKRANNQYAAKRRRDDFNKWIYQVTATYKTRLEDMVYYRTTEYGNAGECHYHFLLGEFGLENHDYATMSLVLAKLWERYGDRICTSIEPFDFERHAKGSGARYPFKREKDYNQPVNYDYEVTNPHLCRGLYTAVYHDKDDFTSPKLESFAKTGNFKSAPPRPPRCEAKIKENIQRLFALDSVEDQPEDMGAFIKDVKGLGCKLDKRLGLTNHEVIKRVAGKPPRQISHKSIQNKDLRTDSFNYLCYDKTLTPCFAKVEWAVKLTLCFRSLDKADNTPDARKARTNDLMGVLSGLARNRYISRHQIACCLVEDFITPNECRIHCYIARHKVSGTGYYYNNRRYDSTKDRILAAEIVEYLEEGEYQEFDVTVCNNATLTLPNNVYPNDALIALVSGKELSAEELPDDDDITELPF